MNLTNELPLRTLLTTAQQGHADMATEIRTEAHVDIERFMGDWYVIASIPTFVDKDVFNAVESYELDYDGSIDTTFTFRRGGFDGVRKTYRPRGYILDDESNAVWGMQFLWPFRGDYRIVYLNEDYSQTIIGRNRRDYAWIMARTPSMSNEDFFQRVRLLREQGYDTSRLKRVPQRWDEQPGNDDRY